MKKLHILLSLCFIFINSYNMQPEIPGFAHVAQTANLLSPILITHATDQLHELALQKKPRTTIGTSALTPAINLKVTKARKIHRNFHIQKKEHKKLFKIKPTVDQKKALLNAIGAEKAALQNMIQWHLTSWTHQYEKLSSQENEILQTQATEDQNEATEKKAN